MLPPIEQNIGVEKGGAVIAPQSPKAMAPVPVPVDAAAKVEPGGSTVKPAEQAAGK